LILQLSIGFEASCSIHGQTGSFEVLRPPRNLASFRMQGAARRIQSGRCDRRDMSWCPKP